MLQNISLPQREATPACIAAVGLPAPTPSTSAAAHKVLLPPITTGEAVLKKWAAPATIVQPTAQSTIYRRKRQEAEETGDRRRNVRTNIYSCGRCEKAKNKDTGHRQIRGRWYCPSNDGDYDSWKTTVAVIDYILL